MKKKKINHIIAKVNEKLVTIFFLFYKFTRAIVVMFWDVI